ncbi:hypothetical protein QF031_003906 [Pseudarthrobacter defluvii]|nr:hypothetical protein [Pseudarthrobacter defluvii]
MDSGEQVQQQRPRPRRVTAAMVAARAGVSVATVSLVANGKTAGRVAEDNISRVRDAIAELGYVVDGIGSSLAKGVSSVVILVAPDISNPFFAKVIAGVRESLGPQYPAAAVRHRGRRISGGRRRAAADVPASGRPAGGRTQRGLPRRPRVAVAPCPARRAGAGGLRALR